MRSLSSDRVDHPKKKKTDKVRQIENPVPLTKVRNILPSSATIDVTMAICSTSLVPEIREGLGIYDVRSGKAWVQG